MQAIAAMAPIAQDIVVAGHDARTSDSSFSLTCLPVGAGLGPPIRCPLARSYCACVYSRIGSDGMKALRQEFPAPRHMQQAHSVLEGPSIDAERSRKGYINQRVVLSRRSDLVEALFPKITRIHSSGEVSSQPCKMSSSYPPLVLHFANRARSLNLTHGATLASCRRRHCRVPTSRRMRSRCHDGLRFSGRCDGWNIARQIALRADLRPASRASPSIDFALRTADHRTGAQRFSRGGRHIRRRGVESISLCRGLEHHIQPEACSSDISPPCTGRCCKRRKT